MITRYQFTAKLIVAFLLLSSCSLSQSWPGTLRDIAIVAKGQSIEESAGDSHNCANVFEQIRTLVEEKKRTLGKIPSDHLVEQETFVVWKTTGTDSGSLYWAIDTACSGGSNLFSPPLVWSSNYRSIPTRGSGVVSGDSD